MSGIIDTDLPSLSPADSLAAVTRYFAAYNLVCGPVVDEENHLLGAVSVDDVLDHMLPDDWRERDEPSSRWPAHEPNFRANARRGMR